MVKKHSTNTNIPNNYQTNNHSLLMYLNQCIQIKWNSMISEKYGIANGLKQGGVLSPILFGIYMDNLIKPLKDSNICCKNR